MLSDAEVRVQNSDIKMIDESQGHVSQEEEKWSGTTKHETHTTVPLVGSIVLLCASTMGAGLLAIPFTFFNIGIVLGSILMVVFGLYNFYAIWMLVNAGKRVDVRNYEDLVAKAFPLGGRIVAAIAIMIVIFGSLVGFLVIIGDVSMPLVNMLTTSTAWYVSRPFIVSMVTVFVILPLAAMRNIGKLEYSSYAAVLIICCFAVMTIYLGSAHVSQGLVDWQNITYVDVELEHIFVSLPIISLAYGCQLNVFPIWKELENPTVKRMNWVLMGNSIVAFLVYISVGFFGYIQYTDGIQSNVILNLPHNIFFNIVRVLFAVAITFHYPVVHFPFRLAVETLFFSKYQFSWIRHMIITVVTVGLSLLCAILLPNLGKVFDLVGSFGAYPVNFIIPVVVYIKLTYWDQASEGEFQSLTGRTVPISVKIRRLLQLRVLVPFIMVVTSVISCIISIYMSIAAFF